MKVAKMVIDNDDMDGYNEQDEPYSPGNYLATHILYLDFVL